MKKITIIDNQGQEIVTTVSDNETAREYENLAFEPGGHIVKVTVTDND